MTSSTPRPEGLGRSNRLRDQPVPDLSPIYESPVTGGSITTPTTLSPRAESPASCESREEEVSTAALMRQMSKLITNMAVIQDNMDKSLKESIAKLTATVSHVTGLQEVNSSMSQQEGNAISYMRKDKAHVQVDADKSDLPPPSQRNQRSLQLGSQTPQCQTYRPNHDSQNRPELQYSPQDTQHPQQHGKNNLQIGFQTQQYQPYQPYKEGTSRHHEQQVNRQHETPRIPVQTAYQSYGPQGTTNIPFHHVEMPIFEGKFAFGWISKMERYFRYHHYSERQKLDMVQLSLAGDALGWYNYEINRGDFYNWQEFKDKLLLRFGNILSRGPSQNLNCIRQTGAVSEYIAKFEDLSAQVNGMDDQQLEGIFLNGLKPSLRSVVLMMKPQSLPEMVAAATAMETEPITRIIAKELQQDYKSNRPYNKAEQDYNSGWRTKTMPTLPQQQVEQRQNNPLIRQQRRLSPAELADKKKKGLCFNCDAKFFTGHKEICPNKQLQVLTFMGGCEVEILDSHFEEEEADIPEELEIGGELMQLSLNAFLGINTPTTTKLRGMIGRTEVIVMLDSGATHNFVSPEVVERAKLTLTADKSLDVLLGTGITVKAYGIAKNQQFSLAGEGFSADFVALELGNTDMILGIQWLQTLGECTMNWNLHRLRFKHQGRKITLLGDSTLHRPSMSLKSLSSPTRGHRDRIPMEFYDTEKSLVTVPSQFEHILEKFDTVFTSPT